MVAMGGRRMRELPMMQQLKNSGLVGMMSKGFVWWGSQRNVELTNSRVTTKMCIKDQLRGGICFTVLSFSVFGCLSLCDLRIEV